MGPDEITIVRKRIASATFSIRFLAHGSINGSRSSFTKEPMQEYLALRAQNHTAPKDCTFEGRNAAIQLSSPLSYSHLAKLLPRAQNARSEPDSNNLVNAENVQKLDFYVPQRTP